MQRRKIAGPEKHIDSVSTLLVATRWIHFVSMSIVFGSSFFWSFIDRGPIAARLARLPSTTTATVRLLRTAALVAAASGVAWLGTTIASVTGAFDSLKDAATLRVFFFETPFGGPAFVRLILFAALAASAVLPLAPRALVTWTSLLAATALVSQAWLGHAAEGGASSYGIAMICSYAVHVLGAAAWVGGLPALAFAVAERRRRKESSYDLLARYSAMAIGAVTLIILSGIANTLFHAGGNLAALAASAYGKVLAVKLTLVAAMLALATLNRLNLMPQLLQAPRGGASGKLMASIAVETVLAVAVLGAAAVLGITPPPH